MKNLSIKTLRTWIIISGSLFTLLVFYIFYLLIEKPTSNYEHNSTQEKGQNVSVSTNNDSNEIIPIIEKIRKDEHLSIDHKKIKAIDIEIKRPSIDESRFHSTFGKKVVFIYFSHNRESFLPYFPKGTRPELAYHSKINISLIGDRLGRSLRLNGIGSNVSDQDILTLLDQKDLKYSQSYAMSRTLVETELGSNSNIELIFDIHRNSLPKEYTTLHVGGIEYAQLSFVVGSSHPNFQENLSFTNNLHTLINANYPGLSRGVIVKNNNQGNGVYNQDLSPHSVIIEIGGVENQLEELFRTSDILGYMISEYYWENFH